MRISKNSKRKFMKRSGGKEGDMFLMAFMSIS